MPPAPSDFIRESSLLRTVLVALTGLLLSLTCWRMMKVQSQEKDALRFDRLVENVRHLVDSRLKYQEQMLGGLEGLFSASESVERREFRAYVNSLHFTPQSGALGFGFIRYVREAEVENFLRRTRADGAPEFAIHALGNPQADRYIIEYIEPNQPNQAAQGLDIATEPNRREAADRAVVENQTVLTHPIVLVQDEKKSAGFLLLRPVFRNRASVQTLAERRQHLLGWVYTPIRIDDLMTGIVEENNRQVDFEVFENDTDRKALLYDDDNHLRSSRDETVTSGKYSTRLYHRSIDYKFGGQHWKIQVSTRPEFTAGNERHFPVLFLIGSLVGTALLTFIVHNARLVQQKAVTLARSMTSELRTEVLHRQSVEHAMQTALRFQETILNSAAFAVISTTPKGIIQVFNPAAQRMLGYTAEEVVGRVSPACFHDPEEVTRHAREFSVELGCPVEPGFETFVIKSCRGLPNEHEWTYLRKDGTRFPVLLSVTAIRDEHGSCTGFLGLAVDITERRRALDEILAARLRSDEALHEVQALRDAMDQHAIVSVTDVRGVIQYVNDRFVAISGYSRKELLGRTHQLVNSGHHPREFWQKFWQTITSGNVWHGEVCNRAKAGHLYWVASTVAPFRNAEGEIDRFVSIRTEITNRVNAEAELVKARQAADAASRSKSDFLAEMSHEIRTPMNAVLGFTDLLTETSLNERQRKFVETIQTSGKNLLHLINDILDYSKIEAGKLAMEPVPFDAVAEIENVIQTLALQARAKQLTLSLAPGTRLTQQTLADPTRVRQVLINLIGNALKFTKEGGVTITLEPLSTGQDLFVRFCVKDTGIGLSTEQQAKLFTRYSQATPTTTREFGGTGLGLAISRKLVELMGGQIGVQSKPGQGSTFWFTLPLSRTPLPASSLPADATSPSSPAATKNSPGPARDPQTDTPRLRVLVADDNLINQQLACAFLTRLDCNYVTVDDGEEAAHAATTKQFDLVLMDYQMPNLNGMEATTAIRHWEEQTGRPERIPIYALTANHDPEIQRNFLACGMNGVLSKPLILADLARIVDNLRNTTKTDPQTTAAPDPVLPPTKPAPPPAEANPSALAMDRPRALQLTDNNPLLLGMLAQAFLAQSDGLLASIHEAFRNRDAKTLKAQAHKLKGSLSVFAADRAFAPVLALNKFNEPADWPQLELVHQELVLELRRLKPELTALGASSPAARPGPGP